jgi:hypothetical protein
MDTSSLVETAQQGGRALLTQLEASGFPVTFAFWWLTPWNNEWRLILASPEVTPGQLRTAYAQVDKALNAIVPKPPFGLNDIVLVPQDEPLVQALRRFVKVVPGSSIRLSNVTLNNVLIESAYVYGMNNSVVK